MNQHPIVYFTKKNPFQKLYQLQRWRYAASSNDGAIAIYPPPQNTPQNTEW